MYELDILEQLEKTSGSKDKIALLKSHSSNKNLAELLDAALNFKRKFHIKKFDMPNNDEPDGDPADHHMFMYLLSTLESRKVTGNDAKDSVWNFFCDCDELQRKWYARVLKKNLQIGIDLSTVNKAGFNIPEFDVMLAKDGKESKKLEEIVKEGVYVSPKFDGYRCIAVCSHGEVTLYSRNGTEYENFPSIVETLSKTCIDSAFVLDGEIMSDDFNKMQQSAFASKRGTTVGDVKYLAFGWIPINEWQSGVFSMPTKQRLDNLGLFFNANPNMSNVELVEQKLVHKVQDILDLEQHYLIMGYEGAMALPNIPYYLGKKTNRLMKFKTFHTQDCKVVGFYLGEADGKYAHTLGGLKLLQENGEKCDMGSGFSDEDRDYIWNHQDEFLGRTVEARYQELTPDNVMRFPTFVRWRNDK